MQRIAVEESRNKIPLMFGLDVIHGYRTVFPIPLALAASFDMDLIERSARIAANEATADGLCWNFSPMVDLTRDPRWGRIAEGFGEDPYLGSRFAEAYVKGYQGDDLSKNNTMMACVKHMALYGAAEGGLDYNTTDMSRLRMFNEYFPPLPCWDQGWRWKRYDLL
jgi:beta-glucosidase